MKNLFFLLLGILMFTSLFAQEVDNMNFRTDGTAYTVNKHRLEIGVFTGSRYGISDNLEVSTHSLISFLAPRVTIKKRWGESAGFRFATEHGVFYPTMFMRMVTGKGTGGLISPEFSIPQMLAVENRLLVSYKPLKNTILSAHLGIAFAIKSDRLDSRATIDLPVFYPRLAMFYNHPEFDLGADFRGMFSPRYGFRFGIENYLLPQTPENYFLENNGILTYTSKRQSFCFEAGYKLCYGRYPFGNQWHLLPLVAMMFGIGK